MIKKSYEQPKVEFEDMPVEQGFSMSVDFDVPDGEDYEDGDGDGEEDWV